MFLKNRHINSKIKRSKVTDYAALKDKMVETFFNQKQLTGWVENFKLPFYDRKKNEAKMMI